MKKALAHWSCQLTVNCPYCGEYQGNIIDNRDEWWSEFTPLVSEQDLEFEHQCDDCKKVFIIDETEY